MKETYVTAEIEIIEFEAEDIITGSNDPADSLPFAPYVPDENSDEE